MKRKTAILLSIATMLLWNGCKPISKESAQFVQNTPPIVLYNPTYDETAYMDDIELYIARQSENLIVLMSPDLTYTVNIVFNDQKELIFYATGFNLYVDEVEDELLQISYSAGTDAQVCIYYDKASKQLSNYFMDVIAIQHGFVAFIAKDKESRNILVIQDIFDKNKYYKEIHREFPNYSDAEYKAGFLNATELEIEYNPAKGDTVDYNNVVKEVIQLYE